MGYHLEYEAGSDIRIRRTVEKKGETVSLEYTLHGERA